MLRAMLTVAAVAVAGLSPLCSGLPAGIFPPTDERPMCAAEAFPCGNSTVCLDRVFHCDGVIHCEGGEDEKNCVDAHGSLRPLIKSIRQPMLNLTGSSNAENCSLRNVPPECTCRFFRFLYCLGQGLTSVPPGISPDVTKLLLGNNSIERLDKGAFQPYEEVRVIHMDRNMLRHLPAGTFLGLKKLTILFLSGNQLTTVEPGAFKDLYQLKWLLMQNNRLRDLDLNALTDTPALQLLDLGDNQLTLDGATFPLLPSLYWLDLKNNRIREVESEMFASLEGLEVLILKNNLIHDIEKDAFVNLQNLVELDLANNRLHTLPSTVFSNLTALSKLNLQYNHFLILPTELFRSLNTLKSLDLRGFEISNIDIKHFEVNFNLEFIYFKKFHYCSYAPYVRICQPKTDGLSSTEHLLVWPVLRMCVWVVALVTCAGNLVVLIWRLLSRKEDHVLSLFIRNLSVADLLMGGYLLAIGSQDLVFRDKYNEHAHSWMSSWRCTTCGVMAMVSSEVSVLILSLITVERYRCIKTNFRTVTATVARYCLVGVWLTGLAIAIFPIFQWPQERSFYSSNGLCFPLHIDEPYMLGWQYSAFVFLGVNFSMVMLIIILYVRMFLIIREDRQRARPVTMKKREDAVLALRFFFIVLTDCLCWIPIVVVKILAFSNVPISDDLYACVVVFVLPINSALNPVIYTIAAPTELRRRIERCVDRMLVCRKRLESLINSESKTTSSVITHGSTDARSNSTSSCPPLTIHSSATSNRHDSRSSVGTIELAKRDETTV